MSPKKALIIDYKLPSPDEDAGLVITYQYMHILKKYGYQVTFIPKSGFSIARDDNAKQLRKQGFCIPNTYSEYLSTHLRRYSYNLIILFRAPQTHQLVNIIRRLNKQALILLHTVDLHYIRESRQAKLLGSPELMKIAENTKAIELEMIRAVNTAIVVSSTEEELLKKLVPGAHIVTIPIPVQTSPNFKVHPLKDRKDIVFIGNYKHDPNIDAIQYFVEQILPLVRKQISQINLSIVGGNAPEEINRLQGPNVRVLGFVSDLEECLNNHRLSIAPIRYGAGIKGKIASSLIAGLPCVSTSIGIEGMNLTPEQQILIGDDPNSFAHQIIRLYTDDALWHNLSNSGKDFANQNWSLAAVENRLIATIHKINLIKR